MIWFFVPASLVICNDIFAYICGELPCHVGKPRYHADLERVLSFSGKTFGKTPLFKLSPKKTVEGFVGAFFCTLIFAVVVSTTFSCRFLVNPRAEQDLLL
jgi:phosphatidate cytidylyltransferase